MILIFLFCSVAVMQSH